MNMKPPAAPPPLAALAARKKSLEDARAIHFALWKQTLEAVHGNVSHAAKVQGCSRDHGNYLTRKLGLAAYAAELRRKATGKDFGRPKGSKKESGR